MEQETQRTIVITPKDLLEYSENQKHDETIIISEFDNLFYQEEVLRLTNLERKQYGAGQLTINSDLCISILNHCIDLATHDIFSHTGSNGSNLKDRVEAVSSSLWMLLGENIAMGQDSPQSVVDAWMQSPGHRSNLLNPDFIEIGIACFLKPKKNAFDFNNVYYWGQNFGTRVSPKSFGPLMERYLPKKIKKQTEDITVTILNEDKIEIKLM